jgi:signal transduction histidine kinase
MRKFTRHFRLLAILFAILIIVYMHWRSHVVALYWREATYRTWAKDIELNEMKRRIMIEHILDKPFVQRDDKIDEFVKPEMDAMGFLNWLRKEARDDSLIGTGVVWWRDVDSLEVVPLSLQKEPAVQEDLHQYMDLTYAPQNYPNMPDSLRSYLDSLRREINESVGFSLYIFQYYRDFENYPTREIQAEAREVAFGIIWNYDYYRTSVLPAITVPMVKDPMTFGLFLGYYPENDYCNGILLTNASNDTIFNLGQVQTVPDSLYLRYAQGFYFPQRPLDRSPGWQLYVQDHWKNDDPQVEGMSLFMPLGRKHGESSESRDALQTIRLMLTVPMIISDRPPMILISVALIILFSMILVQITARNRQRDFIAHVSHELRTPVAKVKLFAETLRFDRAVSEEKEDEYLDTILRESDHLSVLVDNTLNLARLDAGRMAINLQKADLSEWLKQIFEKQEFSLTGSGFSVKLTVEDDLPQVKFDPEALELALNNLIDNAVKYSTDRKDIEIHASRVGKNNVQIAVSDRGIGIPASKRKAVFKRFTRVKPRDREPVGGAGVGLSIVKEIVKRHHGWVWCQARDGGGTTFIVELLASS